MKWKMFLVALWIMTTLLNLHWKVWGGAQKDTIIVEERDAIASSRTYFLRLTASRYTDGFSNHSLMPMQFHVCDCHVVSSFQRGHAI